MARELLPSTFRMRIRFIVFHCQTCIQEKYTLCSPIRQVTMSWNRKFYCRVGYKIFVDIFEGGWRGHWFQNTEAETMSLIGLMVGILPNNNNFDRLDGGSLEGIEDVLFGRIYFFARFILLFQELIDTLKGTPIKILSKGLLPAPQTTLKLLESEERLKSDHNQINTIARMIPNTKRVIEDSEESKAVLNRSQTKSSLIGEEEWERFWKAKQEYFKLKPFEQAKEKSNGSR